MISRKVQAKARCATLALVLGLSVVTAQPRSAEALDPASASDALIALTNLNRTVNGLAALLVDGDLGKVARSRSDDMIARNYFAHQIPPDGTTVVDVLRAAGIGFRSVGENIEWNTAAEAASVQFASNDFMNSPSHRAAIMNARYNRVGAAMTEGLPKRMYAVVFVGRSEEGAPSPPPAPEPAQEPAPEPAPAPEAELAPA